jgi:hypothetical protein
MKLMTTIHKRKSELHNAKTMSILTTERISSFTMFFILCTLLVLSLPSQSEAKRKAIEEIPRRQLDSLLQTEDYLAVFWRKFAF